eukprot:2550674-Rhodomonas_salina.3
MSGPEERRGQLQPGPGRKGWRSGRERAEPEDESASGQRQRSGQDSLVAEVRGAAAAVHSAHAPLPHASLAHAPPPLSSSCKPPPTLLIRDCCTTRAGIPVVFLAPSNRASRWRIDPRPIFKFTNCI